MTTGRNGNGEIGQDFRCGVVSYAALILVGVVAILSVLICLAMLARKSKSTIPMTNLGFPSLTSTGTTTASNSMGVWNVDTARSLIQDAILRYATSSELYITPTFIEISQHGTSSQNSYSAYGVSFGVPWPETPEISTSSPEGLLTFFRFANDKKVVEAFAPGTSVSTIVEGALPAFLAGIKKDGRGSLRAFEELYAANLQSDFDFVSSSLNSTPGQLSVAGALLNESVITATGLLETKEEILNALATDLLPVDRVSAIYAFSTFAIKGFEFSGKLDDGTSTRAISHFLVFDKRGGSFNFLTVGATERENNVIVASLRLD